MRESYIVAVLSAIYIAFINCAAPPYSAEIKIDDTHKVAPKKLSEEDRVELRRLLEVFYSRDKKQWAVAREKIVSMGAEGIEALCLFMIKFFAIGKEDITLQARAEDLGTYWRYAQYELVLLREKAVPYLIIAMAHPKIGTSGRMQCSLTLSRIGKLAVPLLLENLERGTPQFQRVVLETLGDIGDLSAIPKILRVYQSCPPGATEEDMEDTASLGLRLYCIKAVEKIGAKEGLPLIDLALDDPNQLIQKKAIEAVTRFCIPEALAVLKKALAISHKNKWGYHGKLQRCINRINSPTTNASTPMNTQHGIPNH